MFCLSFIIMIMIIITLSFDAASPLTVCPYVVTSAELTGLS